MKKLWLFEDNYTKLKGHFEIISKFNLWIRNDPNFEFTQCYFDVSPPLPRVLHLEHSICPKWTLYDKKSLFYYYFKSFLGNYFCNKWPMRVCHMLGNWWYYIISLSSRFRNLGSFSREFDIKCGRRRELWFVFFSFFIKYIVFSFYLFIQIMDFFYLIMDCECEITPMRG